MTPKKKILIVDDDTYFHQLLSRILTAVGYKVIETSNVSEAKCALEQLPDLAIIDYRMPSSNGANFIKELRENHHKFPIVFCSGSGIDRETFASMVNTFQVDMIIQKPIHPEMFVQQIAELFEQQINKASLVAQAAELERNLESSLSAKEEEEEEEEASSIENKQFAEDLLNQEHLLAETEAAIAELGCIYLLELPNELEQMTTEIQLAAKEGNAISLNKASYRAHQIKGTSGSLGFDALSQLGSAIEKELITAAKLKLPGEDLKWGEILDLVEQAKTWIEAKQASY